MEKLYIGKIVNTHGIKGEVKILSNNSNKDKIFIPGMNIYINNNKEIINSYRHHKIFEMITIKGIDNINDVLKYKGCNVYIDINDLKLDNDEYLLEELVGYSIIYKERDYGIVREIVYNNSSNLLGIDYEKNYYIPNNDNFIKKVDKDKRIIIVDNIEGLII